MSVEISNRPGPSYPCNISKCEFLLGYQQNTFLNLTGRVAHLDVLGSLQGWVPGRWPARHEGVLSVWTIMPAVQWNQEGAKTWWSGHREPPRGWQKGHRHVQIGYTSHSSRPNVIVDNCYHDNKCTNIYLCLIRLLISQTTRLLFWYFLLLTICTLAQYLVSPEI